MKISADQIIKLAEKHKCDLVNEITIDLIKNNKSPNFKTTISFVDALIMYLLILENKPKNIIEFGTYRGYSTSWLTLAASKLGTTITTFEKSIGVIKDFFNKNIEKLGLSEHVRVIQGDALKNIPSHIDKNNLDIDFCFIDSDHSKGTANNYTQKIFPTFNDNCIICIHDISSKTKHTPYNFETNTKGHIRGEHQGVQAWANKMKVDYTLSHVIIGGQFEKSDSIPINQSFYEKLSNIFGFNVQEFNRSAPVMLIATNHK